MPKKELTADVARELAELIEDRAIEKLTIRPRLSGKNKGKLFAEWNLSMVGGDSIPDHLNLMLTETLEDVAKRLSNKQTVSLHVIRDLDNQFITYTRSE